MVFYMQKLHNELFMLVLLYFTLFILILLIILFECCVLMLYIRISLVSECL